MMNNLFELLKNVGYDNAKNLLDKKQNIFGDYLDSFLYVD